MEETAMPLSVKNFRVLSHARWAATLGAERGIDPMPEPVMTRPHSETNLVATS